MPINLDKPQRWKADIAASVDMYNAWFMEFAPRTYQETRLRTTRDVEAALTATGALLGLTPALLKAHPGVLPTLRMCACPPLAVDRLTGLSGASKNVVACLEVGRLPARLSAETLERDLQRLTDVLRKLADPDLFTWLETKTPPTPDALHRAATIVADRLTGAEANPILRNAQERRQLLAIRDWLTARGYSPLERGLTFDKMPPGTFAERLNVPVRIDATKTVNIPVDMAISPRRGDRGLPIFIEAKSAGDFTNVNKRRKEEAQKMTQLRATYGADVSFVLFLCGYFDSGYLGYEAAEGIDWVWEHRMDDLAELGL
ncbi:XamI family restriction endonuclease [Myxococcota bacterium]|nr:XamI family restriction endonuclease [Myxococcota bacterium]